MDRYGSVRMYAYTYDIHVSIAYTYKHFVVCACDVHVLSVCAFIPKVSSMELIVKVLRLIQSQPGAPA